MSLVVPSLRGIVASAPWAKNELWRKALAAPTLDLRFANSKSLTDAVSGQNLITFTRASSGTYVGSDGLIKTALANAPRFDHDPETGESLGLLIEEQRTNLLLKSEEFQTSWSALNVTVSTDTTASATGSLTADTITPAASTAAHLISQSATVLASTPHLASIYIKANGAPFVQVAYDNGGSVGAFINVNTSNGAITRGPDAAGGATNATGGVTPVGNGWYRVSVGATHTGTTGRVLVSVLPAGSSTASINPSTTTTAADKLYLWGAQLEAGAFPTSYIPTTSATVTRNADVASITGSNFSGWYSQSEGTVFAEGDSNTSTPGPSLVTRGVNAGDRHQVALGSGATVNNGVIQVNLSVGYTTGQRKVAYAYSDNDIAFALSTGDLFTDSVATIPTNLTYATLGRFDFGGVASLNGHCRRLTFFDRRLPDATLQAITSP